MTSTRVTVVIPRARGEEDAAAQKIAAFLETTGFSFEIVVARETGLADGVRRAVSEAKGSVIVVVDPALPYPVGAIGDAVALVDPGAADVVFAVSSRRPRTSRFARWLLDSVLPDPAVLLAAFASTAGQVVVGESQMSGEGWPLETAFLANKYGFRVELLNLEVERPRAGSFGALGGSLAAVSIRMANRRNAYRAARRCPVCFSSEVWSCGQTSGNVVRACRRCKCRYLNNHFVGEQEGLPPRRVLRAAAPPPVPGYEAHAAPARERTSLRRFRWLHRQLPPHARVLEVGVRDGSFGALTSAEYEYVGIDPASAAARHARSRGLEVYCASLSSFVNTGPAFDAITLFHVFENMADPHDALGRIKDLLKPGGLLLLSAFDTEGLIYLLSEKKRMAQNFRTHLILYSRSALIELLEHSGFEIIDIGPDFEFRDHRFLRHWLVSHHPRIAALVKPLFAVLPDPAMVSTGSIRIVARRRSGGGTNPRAIRSVEPTHAR